jgi:phage terminase small subunit
MTSTAAKLAQAAKQAKKPATAQKVSSLGASRSMDAKPQASAPAKKKLTARQEQFVKEYLIDLNASQAAVRAGYKGDPNTIGPRLMADVGIRSLVEKAQAQRSQKVELTQERVLLELRRLALFDIRKIFNADGTLKRVVDLDDDTAAAIMSVEMVEIGTDGQLAISKKFKASDKKGALELTMRHMGMLNDKLELTMPTVRIKDFTGKA